MKTNVKLKDILSVRRALVELCHKHFVNYNLVIDLIKMNKILDEQAIYYLDMEGTIVNEYAMKDENGLPKILPDGRAQFNSVEEKNVYEAELTKLQETTFEIDKITIRSKDFKNTTELPTPNEMMLLESIIDWQ